MAPARPQHSLPYRLASSANIGIVGTLSKAFIFGLNRPEIHGLDRFLKLLEERREPEKRERALITVSNHISIMDDPILWGVLPLRYLFDPDNMRWSLGSYDLCFKNKILSAWFFSGQVLPTHRLKHSPLGGLFQPTMTEAVRLLSRPPSDPQVDFSSPPSSFEYPLSSPSISDPFSSPHLTFSTNGTDAFPSPSAYSGRDYAWIHVFPEGRVHQHPRRTMRYFRWGISRLILEPDSCPDIVPMWLEGYESVYPENRGWPRPMPRAGNALKVWFGENVAGAGSEREGNVFGELRRRWRTLVEKEERERGDGEGRNEVGVLSDELKYGREAVELRMECTREVRKAVLALRRETGLPDEDPKQGLAETWREEGTRKGEGRMKDGSWVGDT